MTIQDMAAALAARVSLRQQFSVGTKHGRLLVIAHVGVNPHRQLIIRCACDCGATKDVLAYNVRSGCTLSCGCLGVERNNAKGTHRHRAGNSTSPEYASWRAMMARCTNPNSPNYKNYGGRGISVCQKWALSFDAFLKDMGPRPAPGYTIDRKNNDGDYNKRNCRWATKSQQSRNSRGVVLNMGKARKIRRLVESGSRISDAARLLGVKYGSAWQIAKGLQWREQA